MRIVSSIDTSSNTIHRHDESTKGIHREKKEEIFLHSYDITNYTLTMIKTRDDYS